MNKIFIIRSPEQVQGLASFVQLNWKAAADAGKPLAVSITENKTKRSIEQNKRLHALLQDISEQAWINGRQFDVDTWREHFNQTYIGVDDVVMPNGTTRRRGISSTTLDVQEFGAYMEKITAYAATELGVQFAQAFA